MTALLFGIGVGIGIVIGFFLCLFALAMLAWCQDMRLNSILKP